VSFNVGKVTFEIPPVDTKKTTRIADDLMYDVKKSDKNDITYSIWNKNFCQWPGKL
jgi:hypothetical protein